MQRSLVSQQPGGALLFEGTVSEPASVTVGGAATNVSNQNAFSGSAPVPSGTSQVLVEATDASGNVRTNTYEVSQTGATKAFAYDANGNTISDGTKTFEWDAENRLTAVKQGANTLASFTYDGNGRRTTKTAGGVTTSFVYDGAQFLEERPSAGLPKRYVYGLGIDRPLAQSVGSTTSYFVADHLGSIVQVTDSAGVATLGREYDPWGNLLQGATIGGHAFTGREWDPETGLYYYRARYYDPALARFASEDPLELSARPQEWNSYAYVRNGPLVLTDPLGLSGDWPGYIHSSIPELSVNDGRPGKGETQGGAVLAKETEKACFYACCGSVTRFAAALIGLTKSRIQAACKIKRDICCPKIQAFFVSRSVDAVVIGRVNVYCDQVPRRYDEWKKYEP